MGTLIGTIVTNLVGEHLKNRLAGQDVPVDPAKGIVQSKTMWGVAIGAVSPFIASWLGLEGTEMAEVIQGVTLLVGVALAWYGRKKAKRALG